MRAMKAPLERCLTLHLKYKCEHRKTMKKHQPVSLKCEELSDTHQKKHVRVLITALANYSWLVLVRHMI